MKQSSVANFFKFIQKWLYKNSTILITLLSIVFLVLLAILFYLYRSRERRRHTEPFQSFSIVNLVLYSKDAEYDEMYKITRKYYSQFHNVRTIYYRFNPDITTDYELIGDVLNIKGKETYVPGILDKTVKAFEYVNQHFSFDYLVRSNISTIINFDLLCEELQKTPIQYGAGTKMVLNWLDQPSGIVDKTYFGTNYGSGTSIILSNEALTKFLSKKAFIHYNLIDDVSIGVLFEEQIKDIKISVTDSKYFYSVPDVNGDPKKLLPLIKDKPYNYYRNRQSSRKIDIKQMKIIADYLQNKK